MSEQTHGMQFPKRTNGQMKEQRNSKRFDASLPAQVEYIQAGRAEVQAAELRNISHGGAFIMLNGNADLGTSMDLSILDYENMFGSRLGVGSDQDALNLKIMGKVVRVENSGDAGTRCGVALKFTSPVRFAPLSATAIRTPIEWSGEGGQTLDVE